MSDLVHKTKVVPFLDIGKTATKWMQIKKTTAFALAMNPQTKTFDFISDVTPTEEIDSYQPSLSQSLTMLKGEPDYQEIFDMLYELPTGAKAHRPALIVFYQESGTMEEEGENIEIFKAWHLNALVKVNQMDTVNETIDFDLSFSERKTGAVKLVNGEPVFIAGYWTDGKFNATA